MGHSRNGHFIGSYCPNRSAFRRSQRRRFRSPQRKHSHHRFCRQGKLWLPLPPFQFSPSNETFQPRRSPSGICATSPSNCTRSNRTRTKSSSSPGPPQTPPSSPQPPETAVSTSGTCPRLGSNKRPRTWRTVRLSCCLFMGDIRVARLILRGPRMRIGQSLLLLRITSFRFGDLVRRCMLVRRCRLERRSWSELFAGRQGEEGGEGLGFLERFGFCAFLDGRDSRPFYMNLSSEARDVSC